MTQRANTTKMKCEAYQVENNTPNADRGRSSEIKLSEQIQKKINET